MKKLTVAVVNADVRVLNFALCIILWTKLYVTCSKLIMYTYFHTNYDNHEIMQIIYFFDREWAVS